MWHEIFASLMTERAPDGFEVRSEVKLAPRSARVDLLLLRRIEAAAGDEGVAAAVDASRRPPILRGLWPQLPLVSIVEYKSPARGIRRGDLLRLVEYGARYMAGYRERLPKPSDLGLVLIAPRLSEGLQHDLDYLGWRLGRFSNGYATIENSWYTIFVGFTDEISEAEQDDFLRIFSNAPLKTHDVANWLRYWMTERHDMREIRHREGFDTISDKYFEMFTPAERLSGLAPEQMVSALPVQLLRALSDEYIASLPDEVQREVRARLAAADAEG